ncbi:HWE histidine kinase domain-containing protein [Erythrobacter litoralis]|uniref:HWE histidine kinase domain-containing protein n=1 Tax=Erythrobacter litoralis TaxID=39960 RepID=UPI002435B924|nr:HWE histidine kinase domain-containing protein [Erythrobacter litoralis]
MDRLRRELAESRMQFEALADNIPQLAWMADGTGSIFWYNRRWYDFTGTTLEEMQGWGWKSLHDPELLDGITERWTAAIAAGEPWEDTFPLRSVHGDYRWFLSRALPVTDENGKVALWCGTNTDITDRRENAERILLLMREVNHRARNMLSMVQAIVNRSAGAESDLAQSIAARIEALAANQDILNDHDWQGADLGSIIRQHVTRATRNLDNVVTFEGPDELVLRPSVAEAIGLAMHELATNAIKYGALSQDGGEVTIEWKLDDDPQRPSLSVLWKETGGPPVSAPDRQGFGTTVIKRFPEMATGGKVDIAYKAEGVRWVLTAPKDAVLANTVPLISKIEGLTQ